MYKLGASNNAQRKAKSRRLLKRFEEAVVEMAFKGAGHPSDHEAIEAVYQRARKAILTHMNEV